MKSRTNSAIVSFGIFILMVLVSCARTSREPEPEDYYVVESYDAPSDHWVVVHHATWDGQRQRRRYVLECSGFESATGERMLGRGACSLAVGARLAPDFVKLEAVTHPNQKFWWASEYRAPLFVVDMTNLGLLSVTEDDKNVGGKQVSMTHFRVVKADMEAEK